MRRASFFLTHVAIVLLCLASGPLATGRALASESSSPPAQGQPGPNLDAARSALLAAYPVDIDSAWQEMPLDPQEGTGAGYYFVRRQFGNTTDHRPYLNVACEIDVALSGRPLDGIDLSSYFDDLGPSMAHIDGPTVGAGTVWVLDQITDDAGDLADAIYVAFHAGGAVGVLHLASKRGTIHPDDLAPFATIVARNLTENPRSRPCTQLPLGSLRRIRALY